MLKEHSQYAIVFDDNCKNWTKDQKYNVMFLKKIEQYCNELLRARGWLFLRDVYEYIGIPISKASCLVGWIYEEHNKIGDNFVKFIYDKNDSSSGIIIDFNVDGNIIDRL